jgi:general secretion pathway protein K
MDYKKAGLNYQPANKPFRTFEELQMVSGMDEATLEWLQPLVTVYSGQAQVNMGQASKEVLKVLPNMDSAMIDAYINQRSDNARNNIPPPPLPNATIPAQDTGLANVLTIVSEAMLEDESKAVITAVVRNSPGTGNSPFVVLKWQSYAEGDVSLFSDSMENLIVKQYVQSEYEH